MDTVEKFWSRVVRGAENGRKVQPRSKHVNAKLSADQVRAIRSRYSAEGIRQVDLATEFGVSQRCISLIINYSTYKDVK